MPEERTQYYQLTGWATITAYSEEEMAQALSMTIEELRKTLQGKHNQAGLSYHAHPNSNPERQYIFNERSYAENIAKWQCVQAGGHWFEFDHYYDERQRKACYKCTHCPATRYD